MNKIKWTYERRNINDLIENKDNPRRLSKQKAEKLKKSLEKFGLCKPIVIQPDGKIIEGHQRLRILKSIGVSEVDISIPSRTISEREYQELTIGLNKICGDFDWDILANLWEPSLLLEAGFTEDELFNAVEPKQKPKKLTITLKFELEENLRQVESLLEPIMASLLGSSMQVRCK